MKPTRNIVTPNSNFWKPKGKVWNQKNDDEELGEDEQDKPIFIEEPYGLPRELQPAGKFRKR